MLARRDVERNEGEYPWVFFFAHLREACSYCSQRGRLGGGDSFVWCTAVSAEPGLVPGCFRRVAVSGLTMMYTLERRGLSNVFAWHLFRFERGSVNEHEVLNPTTNNRTRLHCCACQYCPPCGLFGVSCRRWCFTCDTPPAGAPALGRVGRHCCRICLGRLVRWLCSDIHEMTNASAGTTKPGTYHAYDYRFAT